MGKERTRGPNYRHVYEGGPAYGVTTRFAFSGAQIKELRKRRGWSQADLTEMIGAPARTLSRWEQGRPVPIQYACKIYLLMPYPGRGDSRTHHRASPSPLRRKSRFPSFFARRMGPKDPFAFLAVIKLEGGSYHLVWGDARRRDDVISRGGELEFGFSATSGLNENEMLDLARREAKKRRIEVQGLNEPKGEE